MDIHLDLTVAQIKLAGGRSVHSICGRGSAPFPLNYPVVAGNSPMFNLCFLKYEIRFLGLVVREKRLSAWESLQERNVRGCH